MTTTPLMSLVLPTEGGSTDVWGPILETVFGLIDGHDHSTGKGGKVPMAGLNVNADISWSAAGVSRAITDIRALDFSPQPTSGMTALAGALFLNSADNNLYWRTTTGSNVQLTAGAALNIAAFAGGIGGDYSASGALMDFDDATDSYRLRQQTGGGVRQFARVQHSDLDLFEFKAHPTAGVPANRVRLASPAALAANYTLTMPAAVSAGVIRSDVTGVMSIGVTQTINVPLANSSTSPLTATGAGLPNIVSMSSALGPNSGSAWTIKGIPVGARVTAVRMKQTDAVGAPSVLRFVTKPMAALAVPVWAPQGGTFTSSGAGTVQLMSVTGINFTVTSFTEMAVSFSSAAGGTYSTHMIEVDFDGG